MASSVSEFVFNEGVYVMECTFRSEERVWCIQSLSGLVCLKGGFHAKISLAVLEPWVEYCSQEFL